MMDQFSYLSVLLSIVLGLGITQILKGIRGMVLARERVRLYWPTLVWAALLLIMCVQSWWAMFALREVQQWTFAGFAIVLLQITLLYMLAALVLPDFFGNDEVDLRVHYFAHTRAFFGLLFCVVAASLGKSLTLTYHLPDTYDLAFHAVFMTMSLTAAITTREWYHKAMSLFGTVSFTAYIALLFTRLH